MARRPTDDSNIRNLLFEAAQTIPTPRESPAVRSVIGYCDEIVHSLNGFVRNTPQAEASERLMSRASAVGRDRKGECDELWRPAHYAHVRASCVCGAEQLRRCEVVAGFARDNGEAVEGVRDHEVAREAGRQVESFVGIAFGSVEFALHELHTCA
jgi:hypothetical protein